MTRRSLLSLGASVGAGLVLRRKSLAFQSGPRIVQADLEAKAGWIPLAGRQAYRYGYDNQVPGPLIEARPGDTIRIRFTNSLPEETNLHFHGLHVSPTGNADNSFVMVAPGEQYHQTGVLFAFGSETMGLDLMDHPHTMRSMLQKLVRSYALDAVEAPHAPAAATGGAAEFLARVGNSEPLIRKAVGMGEDVRLTEESISGAALWAEQRYIHLCAFTTNGTSGPGGFRTSISRPARRRARS